LGDRPISTPTGKGADPAGALFTYLAYVYLQVVMGNMLNNLFLAWTALFSIGLFGLALVLKGVDLTDISVKIAPGFPRKSVAVYMIIMGVLLLLSDLSDIIPFYTTGKPPTSLYHYTTLELFALELGIIIPLYIIGALLLWRKQAWGYIISSLLVFTLFMSSIGITLAYICSQSGLSAATS